MDNSIIVISTTEILSEKCRKIISEEKLSYPVYACFTEEALKLAKESVKNGTKVIISRGGTAKMLRQNIDIPVVDVRHTYEDFYLSAQKALKKYKKVAFVGYETFCESYSRFRNISEINADIININDYKSIDAAFKILKDKGTEAVIGGYAIMDASEKYGINYIKSEANESVIRYTLKEAQYYLALELKKSEEYEIVNSIIRNISEGIIGVDGKGSISYINSAAQKMVGVDVKGKYINDVILEIDIDDVIKKGNTISGKLINAGNSSLALSCIPINVDNAIIGAVITVQDTEEIQTIDVKIRKKHLNKGHYAKKNFDDIIGNSKTMQEVKRKAKKFALTYETILISGETGVGKELFAQSMHNYSNRKNEPFVAINCAALPQNILESELFGYVKGAFTGAKNEGKEGIFELAHRGTVFLDEISEAPLDVQAKLLRVIQEREVVRIGDDKVIPIDVRIIAATNRNLISLIENREFREDLYYRLCVLELNIPPLRERKDDILDLIEYFLKKDKADVKSETKEIAPEAKRMLLAFDWFGNVRELGNIIKRLEVMCDGDIIDVNLVREATQKIRDKTTVTDAALKKEPGDLFDVDTELIRNTLKLTNGNRARTAEMLGISKTTLWRKMKKIRENYKR